MKRVSYKVAKVIKEAGYPQGHTGMCYDISGTLCDWVKADANIDAPFAMDVWLWLWREKKIKVSLDLSCRTLTSINADYWIGDIDSVSKDPEEAIIAAIDAALEHLSKNKNKQ